jgi:hypothetical protein
MSTIKVYGDQQQVPLHFVKTANAAGISYGASKLEAGKKNNQPAG